MSSLRFFSRANYLEPYGLPFRIMYYSQSLTLAHYHDFEELVMVLEGGARHETDGEFYPISSGDVFLIRSGSVHSYHDPHKLLLANLMFEIDFLDREKLDLEDIPGYQAFFRTEPELRRASGFKARLNVLGSGLDELRLLVTKLERECSCRPPGFRYLARAYFRELIALISRSYEQDEKYYSRRMVTLSKMVNFMDARYADPITRDDILRAGAVSISSASRMFQELLHKSMIDYLLEVRVGHASRLLTETDASIGEIAFRCGFRDSGYFFRAVPENHGRFSP